MAAMNRGRSAFVAIRAPNGEYAIVYSEKRRMYHALGGKLRQGELPKTGVRREVIEEIDFAMNKERLIKIGLRTEYYDVQGTWIEHFFLYNMTKRELHEYKEKTKHGEDGMHLNWVDPSSIRLFKASEMASTRALRGLLYYVGELNRHVLTTREVSDSVLADPFQESFLERITKEVSNGDVVDDH